MKKCWTCSPKEVNPLKCKITTISSKSSLKLKSLKNTRSTPRLLEHLLHLSGSKTSSMLQFYLRRTPNCRAWSRRDTLRLANLMSQRILIGEICIYLKSKLKSEQSLWLCFLWCCFGVLINFSTSSQNYNSATRYLNK